jgi:hypothetical protein
VWSLEVLLAIVLVAAAASAVTWLLRGVQRGRIVWAPLMGLAVFAAVVWLHDVVPRRHLGRALPWTSLAAGAALLWLAWTRRHDRATAVRLVPAIAWAVFSFLLLTKVLLNVRISHYGFVLALPATLLLVATLVWAIPALLASRLGSGAPARAILTGVILAAVVFFLRWSSALYATKIQPVGEGGDVMFAGDPRRDPRGYAVALAADRLRARMPPDATLMALPEGVILNYWLKRPNPTRNIYFVPWSLAFAGGEARVLEDMQAHPPDFIAVIHRESDEYGVGYFGADPSYGHQIMEWIRRDYERFDRLGGEPLTDGQFGILLLQRRAR